MTYHSALVSVAGSTQTVSIEIGSGWCVGEAVCCRSTAGSESDGCNDCDLQHPIKLLLHRAARFYSIRLYPSSKPLVALRQETRPLFKPPVSSTYQSSLLFDI